MLNVLQLLNSAFISLLIRLCKYDFVCHLSMTNYILKIFKNIFLLCSERSPGLSYYLSVFPQRSVLFSIHLLRCCR